MLFGKVSGSSGKKNTGVPGSLLGKGVLSVCRGTSELYFSVIVLYLFLFFVIMFSYLDYLTKDLATLG